MSRLNIRRHTVERHERNLEISKTVDAVRAKPLQVEIMKYECTAYISISKVVNNFFWRFFESLFLA
jgi:hypothetical protein